MYILSLRWGIRVGINNKKINVLNENIQPEAIMNGYRKPEQHKFRLLFIRE